MSDRHFHFAKEVTYIEKQEITVQPGGHLHFGGDVASESKERTATDTDAQLPHALNTARGRQVLQQAMDDNLIDDNYQPTMSRPKAAIMANHIGKVLNIENVWAVFEQLWHRNNMAQDYYEAMNSQYFEKELKKIKNIIY